MIKERKPIEHRTPREGNSNNCGTFADNLKLPVHRWFKYPAGFSYKLVEGKIREYSLDHNSWILDPFVGCGTTLVEAKRHGVNSVGIEPHSFVRWVAVTKVFWEFDLPKLYRVIASTIETVRQKLEKSSSGSIDVDGFPELLYKCYSRYNLAKLRTIRDNIRRTVKDEKARDFLNLALTDTLRTASRAGAGWPYIAPSKYHEKQEKDAFEVFAKQAYRMFDDLRYILKVKSSNSAKCIVIQGDARLNQAQIGSHSVDLVITSPPYLNNYDYADRTRLELYFFGHATTWGEITATIRRKLMIAATTQVDRSHFDLEKPLSSGIEQSSPQVYGELSQRICDLGEMRLRKGGRKSYDLMVAGYFNDMYEVLKQVHRYLKPGCDFILILGDSAPYGVHIPTDRYLGELALGLGYTECSLEVLRVRGRKWANNPQRHKVPLREAIVRIRK